MNYNDNIIIDQIKTEAQKKKVLEMILDGWHIENYDGYEVEMRKGYSYKMVKQSGSYYTV